MLGSMGVHVGPATDSKPTETKEKVLKRRDKKQEGQGDVDMAAECDTLDSMTKLKLTMSSFTTPDY